MIKYRPHRGSLEDAMKEQHLFSDIAEMLKYIEDKSEGTIKAKNIVLSASLGEDERIEWKSVRNVLTTQYGSIKYSAPICIGWCDLGELG